MDKQTLRSHLKFEVLAKLFFDITEERYPSGEKMKQLVGKIVDPMTQDPYENIHLKIAVLSAMRNMVREVAPNLLYRSLQHRDEVFAAIIQGLEDYEDILEEVLEKMTNEEED